MATRTVELENNMWTLVGNVSASVVKNNGRFSAWLATGSAPPDFRIMGGNPLMTDEILNVELSEGESLYAYAHASSGVTGPLVIFVTE